MVSNMTKKELVQTIIETLKLTNSLESAIKIEEKLNEAVTELGGSIDSKF